MPVKKPPILSRHYLKKKIEEWEEKGGDTQQRATSHVKSEFILIFGISLSFFVL